MVHMAHLDSAVVCLKDAQALAIFSRQRCSGGPGAELVHSGASQASKTPVSKWCSKIRSPTIDIYRNHDSQASDP